MLNLHKNKERDVFLLSVFRVTSVQILHSSLKNKQFKMANVNNLILIVLEFYELDSAISKPKRDDKGS